MIEVYIKDNNTFNNIILYFQSLISFLIFIITGPSLIYLFSKQYKILDELNIQIQPLIAIGVFISISVYKLIIIYIFGTNITQYDLHIIIVTYSTIIYTAIHLWFLTNIKLAQQIIICCIYFILIMIVFLQIKLQKYIVIMCEKSSCDDQYQQLLFPISYYCNLDNGRFIMIFSQTSINIQQVDDDISIEEFMSHQPLSQHFYNKNYVLFLLNVHIENNKITEQSIYNNRGLKIKRFQYKIKNNQNVYLRSFTKLLH